MKKLLNYLWFTLVSIYVVLLHIPITKLISLIRKREQISFEEQEEIAKKTMTRNFIFQYWTGDTKHAQQNRVFVYFLFPAMLSFVLFVITPFLMGIYYSFTNWTGLNTGSQVFNGLENYKQLFGDFKFFYSFYRTTLYSVFNIIAINGVAFTLAMLVTQNLKGKNIYRAGFFMPNLIGGLVLGYIWQFVFNRALTQVGGIFEPTWLLESDSALMALILVVTWQYAGYIMMIYIAAIQNIPTELIEASKIEGANWHQRLRFVTLPLVAQAFTIALFLTLVTSFKQFDTVVSLTQGFPSAKVPQWIMNLYGIEGTQTVFSLDLIANNIYKEAFTRYNMALGQAKAIVFFVILMAISIVQVYFNKRREIEL